MLYISRRRRTRTHKKYQHRAHCGARRCARARARAAGGGRGGAAASVDISRAIWRCRAAHLLPALARTTNGGGTLPLTSRIGSFTYRKPTTIRAAFVPTVDPAAGRCPSSGTRAASSPGPPATASVTTSGGGAAAAEQRKLRVGVVGLGGRGTAPRTMERSERLRAKIDVVALADVDPAALVNKRRDTLFNKLVMIERRSTLYSSSHHTTTTHQ